MSTEATALCLKCYLRKSVLWDSKTIREPGKRGLRDGGLGGAYEIA